MVCLPPPNSCGCSLQMVHLSPPASCGCSSQIFFKGASPTSKFTRLFSSNGAPLNRGVNGRWINKQSHMCVSKQQLLSALKTPSIFSNNNLIYNFFFKKNGLMPSFIFLFLNLFSISHPAPLCSHDNGRNNKNSPLFFISF